METQGFSLGPFLEHMVNRWTRRIFPCHMGASYSGPPPRTVLMTHRSRCIKCVKTVSGSPCRRKSQVEPYLCVHTFACITTC